MKARNSLGVAAGAGRADHAQARRRQADGTEKDIATNPNQLEFTLLDFAAQSRSLPDLDAAVGWAEYYLTAKVLLSKQIFAPPAPDEFAGQPTIGSKWADTDNITKLVETFEDPAVQQFLATDPSVKDILLQRQEGRSGSQRRYVACRGHREAVRRGQACL